MQRHETPARDRARGRASGREVRRAAPGRRARWRLPDVPPSVYAVVVYAILVRLVFTFLVTTRPPGAPVLPPPFAAAPDARATLLGALALVDGLLALYLALDVTGTALRTRGLRLRDGVAGALALTVLAAVHVAVVTFP